MSNVGLFPNLQKRQYSQLIGEIIDWFEKNMHPVYMLKSLAESLGKPYLATEWDFLKGNIDMAITLGGDGTLLNVARRLAPYKVPILGINLGHLGFLTEIELADLYTDLEWLKRREYFLEKRMMLEASIIRQDEVIKKYLALNDVVVSKGPFARLIWIKVSSNDTYLDTYPADGIIISTPTGSTAYSLSAGGPIINPTMELLLLNPICPHSLRSRPIILSKDEIIKIEQNTLENSEAILTVDGQEGFQLMPGDEVIVKKAEFYTRLIKIKKRYFYDILRKKLTETD